jgi:hypothetical protein
LEQNYSNEKLLLQRGHSLKKSLQAENLKLEKAQTQQNEHRYTLQALNEKLDTVKKNFNEIDEVNAVLHSNISALESKKVALKSEFDKEE